MLSDLALPELRQYRPEVEEPADFDEFWAGQLADAHGLGGEASFARADTPVRHAEVFDVTFPGYGGEPVRGWLLVPTCWPPIPPWWSSSSATAAAAARRLTGSPGAAPGTRT